MDGSENEGIGHGCVERRMHEKGARILGGFVVNGSEGKDMAASGLVNMDQSSITH